MAFEDSDESLLQEVSAAGRAAGQAAESRDERVVQQAAALFLRSGLSTVKMTDIAQASGVGVATLYRRFSTKTHLAILAATMLWRRFNQRIRVLVESNEFLAMMGAERLETLLREYAARYVANRDFVSFLDEFDHLMLQEGVDKEELSDYGEEVDSFYIIFEDAYELGISDGSVVAIPNFATFYKTVAHALMGVAKKLLRGEVIPSDDFGNGSDEIECLVNMAVGYLHA